MTTPFTLSNWYWAVAGSASQVYSSAAGDYVPVTDAAYVAWRAGGNAPSKIDTETNLGGVQGLTRPVNVNVLSAWQTTQANILDLVQFRILFNHENRIRTLEGKASITAAQFTSGVAALL